MTTRQYDEMPGPEQPRRAPWRIAALAALVLGALGLGALGGAARLNATGVEAAPGGVSGSAGYGPGGMMGGRYGPGGYGPGGMMGGSGGYGPGGMMGGSGPGRGSATPAAGTGTRLSGDQVRQAVTNYVARYYPGQDLTIAEIMEFQNNFYAQIREGATGSDAFELLIDPYSGGVWPEYGPNMMWNTKYGHMGTGGHGMMGGYGPTTGQPTTDMPVTPAQAVAAARAYLQAQGGGLTAADRPDTFYGYYTIHTLHDGQIEGMLSVNGYTGAVWYHTWHGAFLGMVGSGD